MIKKGSGIFGFQNFFVFGALVKGGINVGVTLATFFTILYLCIR